MLVFAEGFPPPAALARVDLPRKRERCSRARGALSEWRYFAFPARLSRNTPCSPNMFQNHQGALSRSGRP
jgi:hypothetical protein